MVGNDSATAGSAVSFFFFYSCYGQTADQKPTKIQIRYQAMNHRKGLVEGLEGERKRRKKVINSTSSLNKIACYKNSTIPKIRKFTIYLRRGVRVGRRENPKPTKNVPQKREQVDEEEMGGLCHLYGAQKPEGQLVAYRVLPSVQCCPAAPL